MLRQRRRMQGPPIYTVFVELCLIYDAAGTLLRNRSVMEILAIFNAKGGVAKTTTAVNLATCFAALGQRVLIFDLDSQGNATSCLGIATAPEIGTYDVITGRVAIGDAIHDTFIENIKLIAATKTLAAIDFDFLLGDRKKDIIRRVVQPIKKDIDIIVLDCPPAFGLMTVNALVSADAVLIPSQPTPFAHDGLLRTWTILCRLRSELNRKLSIIGILPTFIPANTDKTSGDDAEKTNCASILATMNAEFGDIVHTEGVPLDLSLFTEATSKGVPACVLLPESPPSICYLNLAARILRIGAPGEANSADKDTNIKNSSGEDGILHWLDRNYILDHSKIKQAIKRIYKWRDIAEAEGILAKNGNIPLVDEAAIDAVTHINKIDDSGYPDYSKILNVLGFIGVILLGIIIAFLFRWRTGFGFF